MLWQGVSAKWITHFPNGRHILDDGVTTDEEWWAREDAFVASHLCGIQELTDDEKLNNRLTELGY